MYNVYVWKETRFSSHGAHLGILRTEHGLAFTYFPPLVIDTSTAFSFVDDASRDRGEDDILKVGTPERYSWRVCVEMRT